jgi:hypothetical protein
MEEKKLTDEVIVKALEHCLHNRSCSYCYNNDEVGSGETVCRARLMGKSINLIHRLQKENEELKSPKFASWKLKFFNLKDELKEERENMQAVIFGLEEDKRLLQKQVDELNERIEVREKEMFEVVKDCQRLTVEKEQAVKDTAKEIADWLDNEKGYCGLGYLVKKRYGVSYEENN